MKRNLQRFGLLPFTDPTSPSLVSLVVGAPVSGSWWGHPAGSAIYQVGETLESDPDIVVLRLWRGKQTLVHRRLFPALERVARARAPWQMAGLSKGRRRLLVLIDRAGLIQSDPFSSGVGPGWVGTSADLRDLGRRLLVLTRSVHTSSGAHALQGESWAAWRKRVRSPGYRGSVPSARIQLEQAARWLTPGVEPGPFFPWGRTGQRAAST
ncbi:MAG: hypothetical protein WA688_00725 [Thermoplasmata archaeon]